MWISPDKPILRHNDSNACSVTEQAPPIRDGCRRMSTHEKISGMAALSICESLLLALNDAHVLPEREIMGVLTDAAASHENAGNETVSDLRDSEIDPIYVYQNIAH